MTTRATRQLSALTGLLEQTPHFRSAQQLHAVLAQQGESISLSTVYRRLNALAEAGELDVIHTPDGEARYRRCQRSEHHHHLVCRDCGHTVELTETTVERWAARTARRHGFSEIDHALDLSGRCADCRPSDHREPPPQGPT